MEDTIEKSEVEDISKIKSSEMDEIDPWREGTGVSYVIEDEHRETHLGDLNSHSILYKLVYDTENGFEDGLYRVKWSSTKYKCKVITSTQHSELEQIGETEEGTSEEYGSFWNHNGYYNFKDLGNDVVECELLTSEFVGKAGRLKVFRIGVDKHIYSIDAEGKETYSEEVGGSKIIVETSADKVVWGDEVSIVTGADDRFYEFKGWHVYEGGEYKLVSSNTLYTFRANRSLSDQSYSYSFTAMYHIKHVEFTVLDKRDDGYNLTVCGKRAGESGWVDAGTKLTLTASRSHWAQPFVLTSPVEIALKAEEGYDNHKYAPEDKNIIMNTDYGGLYSLRGGGIVVPETEWEMEPKTGAGKYTKTYADFEDSDYYYAVYGGYKIRVESLDERYHTVNIKVTQVSGSRDNPETETLLNYTYDLPAEIPIGNISKTNQGIAVYKDTLNPYSYSYPKKIKLYFPTGYLMYEKSSGKLLYKKT